jgi:hypothetical protein
MWALERSVMGKLVEDAAVFFGLAQRSLAHAALKAPARELNATRKELGEVKDLLLQLQRRKP